MSPGPSPKVIQEREGVASRAIVIAAIAAVVIGALAVVISSRLQGSEGGRSSGDPVAPHESPGPAPHAIGVVEQTLIDAREDGLSDRRRGEGDLRRYAWVDRAHGIARIPIDRAIDVYVAEHGVDAGARP